MALDWDPLKAWQYAVHANGFEPDIDGPDIYEGFDEPDRTKIGTVVFPQNKRLVPLQPSLISSDGGRTFVEESGRSLIAYGSNRTVLIRTEAGVVQQSPSSLSEGQRLVSSTVGPISLAKLNKQDETINLGSPELEMVIASTRMSFEHGGENRLASQHRATGQPRHEILYHRNDRRSKCSSW